MGSCVQHQNIFNTGGQEKIMNLWVLICLSSHTSVTSQKYFSFGTFCQYIYSFTSNSFKRRQSLSFPTIIESPKDFNNSLRYFWVIILLSQNYFFGMCTADQHKVIILEPQLFLKWTWTWIWISSFPWSGFGLGFTF